MADLEDPEAFPGQEATADPDLPCPHPDYFVDALVVGVSESEDAPHNGIIVQLRAWCTKCHSPVLWHPTALTIPNPVRSEDGQVIRLPGHIDDGQPKLDLWTP